jgi:hypothetical protein
VAGYAVETISVDGRTTALGSAGPFTLVVDRPIEAGGGGQGFSGGQLLNLAVAGCISNDLFRRRFQTRSWNCSEGRAYGRSAIVRFKFELCPEEPRLIVSRISFYGRTMFAVWTWPEDVQVQGM